jgi:hypothetical protein
VGFEKSGAQDLHWRALLSNEGFSEMVEEIEETRFPKIETRL